MATDLGQLKYSLLLDNAGLAGGLTAAKSMLSQQIPEMGKFFDNLSEKSGNMQKAVGVAAAGVAVGVAAIAGEAIHTAANFQTMSTTLVTTAGESKDAIDKVRAGMLDISTQTGTDVDKLNTALYTIESAGYHGANGLTILRAAAEGAKTENADLGKVADAVTSAMRDYHEPADQAANVTSKLVAAVGAGKSTFEGFTGALHNVLPVASAAHVSMNDILGSIASMTVHGMSADQATQDLAHSIGKMMSPTQQMTSELSQLGIDSSQLSDNLGKKGISGTLDEISDAIMNKMGPAGKVMLNAFNGNKVMARDAMTEIAAMPPTLQKLAQSYVDGTISAGDYRKEIKALPTDQANLMTQFTSLAGHAHGFSDALKSGINTSQSYAQALQKATGDTTTMNTALLISGENANYTKGAVDAVGKAHAEAGGHVEGWAYIQKNFNQQQSEAKEALKNTSIAIGSALLPVATQLMQAITKIVTPIAEWIEKHQKLAALILGAVGIFATFVATVLLIAKAFNTVKMAWEILNATFLTNPIFLAIAAIIAIVILLVTHWDTVKKVAEQVWHDVSGFFTSLWHDVENIFSNIWKAISGAFGGAVDEVKKLPMQILDATLGFDKLLFNAGVDLIKGLVGGITNMAGHAVDAIKNVGKSIVNGAKDILKIFSPSRVFADIGQNVSIGLAQGIGDTAEKAVGATQSMAQGVIGAGSTIPNAVGSNAPTGGSVIYNFGAGAIGFYTKEAVDEFFSIGNRNTQLEGMGVAPLAGTTGI